MFFAEFSKRKHCWCIFEELYCHEQIRFFHIQCCFLICLHFSIGCDIPLEESWKLALSPFLLSSSSFSLSMCVDAPESTTNSLSSGFGQDGAGMHRTSKGEKKRSFIPIFELHDTFGHSPRISAGTSLLHVCLPEAYPRIWERTDFAHEEKCVESLQATDPSFPRF